MLALGRPSSAGMQASFGIIIAINGPARTWRGGLLDQFYQTETVPYPGFSGGPLVDASGGAARSEHLRPDARRGPHHPRLRSLEHRRGARRARRGQRGYLGVRTQPVEDGLLILWLEDGGPAKTGGLMVGDILTGVNGQSLKDADDLFASLQGDVVGKPVSVEVLRGGQPQTLKVTPGERK